METNIPNQKKINYLDLFKNPNDLTINRLWLMYAEAIFAGKKVGQIQYNETQRAFYVGFSECFRVLTDVSDALTEEKVDVILSRILEESNAYINALIESRDKK